MDPELYNAATSGNVDILRGSATREDAAKFVSQLTPNQSSILHISAEWNHLSFFTEATLLCPPSLLEHTNYAGNTVLHIAAHAGSAEVVAFIIGHAKQLSPPSDDIEAGRQGYKELLRIQNMDGNNALHLAASFGHDEVAETLVEADPELAKYTNYKEESPCFLAAAHGRLTIVKLLLNLNIPCSLRGGKHGMTALHAAWYYYGYPGIMKEILEKRPETIREGDAIGWTLLHYAAQHGDIYNFKKLLERDPLVAYVVGAAGESALHIAAYNGHIDVIKELTRSRPDCWHLVDSKRRTALHVAVLGGRERVVEHILHLPELQGIEYIADEDGNTPLHLAALCRSKPMMAIITRFYPGWKFKATNKEYETPMDIYTKLMNTPPGYERGLISALHACKGLKRRQNSAVKQVEEIMKDAKASLMVNQGAPKAVVGAGGLHQLTAPLIVTVTFAAGLTMPGGYIQSGDDNQGVAVLLSNSAFKAFVIFDILAFFASITVVVLQFTRKNKVPKISKASGVRVLRFSNLCMGVAFFSMRLAFACGIYVVISKSMGFGLTALLLSVCLTILSMTGPQFVSDPPLWFSMGRRKLWKALKLA